jgi:streptogramin lyase
VAVAKSGDVYVSDGYANARVHRFGLDGELLQSWGEPGPGRGQFHTPHSLWVLDDGRVMVADRQNERIQFFGPDGGYLGEWTDIQRPQDLFVDAHGLVYVAELSWLPGDDAPRRGTVTAYIPPRVSVFDLSGNLLLRWSDPDPTKPGYFSAPHGIWVDDEGALYLAEVPQTFAVSRQLVEPGARALQKFARL